MITSYLKEIEIKWLLFNSLTFLSLFGFSISEQAIKSTQVRCQIPNGYNIFSRHSFDVNGDGIRDSLFIIKATKVDRIVENQFGIKVDRNRRGILVFLSMDKDYKLVSQNLGCFLSENEEGGNYFPPELYIEPFKEGLSVNYSHGRYGNRSYNFKFDNSDFHLISYHSAESTSGSTAYYQTTTIDLLKQKKYININISKSDIGGEEEYETSIEDCPNTKAYILSEIVNFYDIKFCTS